MATYPPGSIHEPHFDRRAVLENISMVVPTLGRPILENCLTKIISGTHWPQVLIIVHQGDDPRVREWVGRLEEIGVETDYVVSTDRGKPAAINTAFRRTQTRFVCMIDDDCFVSPEWLRNMQNRLHENPEWIVTGRVEPAGNESVAIVQRREPSVQFQPRLKFDLFVGGNMGASMDIVRRVGLFDEDPLLRNAAEDVEWGYRALRKGVPISYAPDVMVSHFGWRDQKGKFDRFRSYAFGHGGFYGKYVRRGDWFILARAAGHFLRALRRWVRGALRGDAEMAMLGRAYFLNLFPGMLAGLRSNIEPGELK